MAELPLKDMKEIQKCLTDLTSDDATKRATACWRIGEKLGGSTDGERPTVPRTLLPPATTDLRQWVEQQPKPEGKLMAVRILGSAGGDWDADAAQVLLDIAEKGAEVDQRAWALYALSLQRRQISSAELNRLEGVLDDPEAKVRQWAAFALGRLASEPPSSGKARLDETAYPTVEEGLGKRWEVEIDTYVCRALVTAMGHAGGYATPSEGAGPAAALLQNAIKKRHAEVSAELPEAVSGVARNVTERSEELLKEPEKVKILRALLQALQDWLMRPKLSYDAYRAAILTIVELVPLMLKRAQPDGQALAQTGLELLLGLAESPKYPIDNGLREPVQERSLLALEDMKDKAGQDKTGQLDLLLDQAVDGLKLMLCRCSESSAAQVLRSLTKLMGPDKAAKFYADVILEDKPATAAAQHYLTFRGELKPDIQLRDEVFAQLRDRKITEAAAQERLEGRARQRAAQALGSIDAASNPEAFQRLDKALQSQVSPACERARDALSKMGGPAAASTLVAAARREWLETKFFKPIDDADIKGGVLLDRAVSMSETSWRFTLVASVVATAIGAVLLLITIAQFRAAKGLELPTLATGLGGVVSVVVGLLTPFFWNAAAAVQKSSADMTRLVTAFHGYMGRMRLLGLGFADLSTRQQSDVQVLTTLAGAAGDAMLDSAGVLSEVSTWPSGKGMVKVPDVSGKTWAEAALLAKERGLEVAVKELAYSEKDEGKVSAQTPAANSTVETGSAIELTLSKGKEAEGAAKETEVPDLKGKTYADAETAAKGKGLTVTYAGSKTDAATKETVIEQQPPAGTKVVSGSAVKLTLSDGPAPALIAVPALSGKTTGEAQKALSDQKLVLNIEAFAFDLNVGEGLIVSQRTPAGTKVAEGTPVSVTISKGKAKVPDLKGKNWADAGTAAKGQDLVVEYAGSKPDAAPKETVIEQQPAAGTAVASGSAVKVTLSDGPAPAVLPAVPSLLRKTLASAKDELEAKKLKLTVGSFVFHPEIGDGLVVSQDIPADTKVEEGTAVSVTISKGKQP